MPSNESIEISRRATAIYERQLRRKLEAENPDKFVAIEPESGDHYVGNTLSAAVQAAREAHPNRLPFTIRVGHTSTVELGVVLS